jgi:hypothetical protein
MPSKKAWVEKSVGLIKEGVEHKHLKGFFNVANGRESTVNRALDGSIYPG